MATVNIFIIIVLYHLYDRGDRFMKTMIWFCIILVTMDSLFSAATIILKLLK